MIKTYKNLNMTTINKNKLIKFYCAISKKILNKLL